MYHCQPNIPVIPTDTFLFKADNPTGFYDYKILDIKLLECSHYGREHFFQGSIQTLLNQDF